MSVAPFTLVDGFVPVLDLMAATADDQERRRGFARELDRICATSGFFVVVNHGVALATINAMRDATTAFFQSPLDQKAALAANPADPLMRGFGREQEPAARRGPDPAAAMLETFVINRMGEPNQARRTVAADPTMHAPNQWPGLPGFREAYLAYFAAVERLAMRLMNLFALALDLPEGWFDDKFTDHMTSLAANFYPRPAAPPAAGEIRKGEHTDWGTLTVLYKDDTATGLQVYDRKGNWLDVPAVPQSFVINIGDLMAQWTNNRWASTVHRVIHTARGDGHGDRYSIAFFHQPDPDAVIECIPNCVDAGGTPAHPPTTFGDYMAGKVRRAHMYRLIGQRTSVSASEDR